MTRFIKHLLLLFLVLSFVPLLPFTGFSQSPNPVKNNASFVIKPGHEPEILAVFNNPQHFSPFKLKNISIQNDSIMLGYSSPDGSILEFELVHPSTVGRSLSKSDEFVIIPKSESPNSTLLISKIQGALAGAKKLDLWNSATFGIPETTGFTDFVFNNSLILLWFALFLLMVLSWPTIEGFGLFPALSLFILSWALRKWFGLVSPGNWDIILTLYGQASVSIFSLLAFLDRLTPANLIAVARILGALAPVFVAMAAYELKPSRTYALTAGVLLSMQPLLIRFSSDCERQSYVIFLASVAIWGVTRFLKDKSFLSLATALVALFLCGETRPEALAIVPIALILVWPGNRLSKASLVIIIPVILFAIKWALNFPVHEIKGGYDSITVNSIALGNHGFLLDLFFDGNFTPPVISFFVVLGIFVGLHTNARTVIWAFLALVLMQLIRIKEPSYGLNFSTARFATLGFIPFSILGAFTLEEMVRRIPWNSIRYFSLVIIFLLLGFSGVKQYKAVLTPTTIDLEFQYLVNELPHLPRNAVIYSPNLKYDFGFRAFEAVSIMVGRGDLNWKTWDFNGEGFEDSAFFYMHSLCQGNPKPVFQRQITVGPQGEASQSDDFDPQKIHPWLLEVIEQCQQATQYIGDEPIGLKTLPGRATYLENYLIPQVQVGFWPLIVRKF